MRVHCVRQVILVSILAGPLLYSMNVYSAVSMIRNGKFSLPNGTLLSLVEPKDCPQHVDSLSARYQKHLLDFHLPKDKNDTTFLLKFYQKFGLSHLDELTYEEYRPLIAAYSYKYGLDVTADETRRDKQIREFQERRATLFHREFESLFREYCKGPRTEEDHPNQEIPVKIKSKKGSVISTFIGSRSVLYASEDLKFLAFVSLKNDRAQFESCFNPGAPGTVSISSLRDKKVQQFDSSQKSNKGVLYTEILLMSPELIPGDLSFQRLEDLRTSIKYQVESHCERAARSRPQLKSFTEMVFKPRN